MDSNIMIPVASQQIIEEQEALENSIRVDASDSKNSRFNLPKLKNQDSLKKSGLPPLPQIQRYQTKQPEHNRELSPDPEISFKEQFVQHVNSKALG